MKWHFDLFERFTGPISPGGRLAIVLFSFGLATWGTVQYFERAYIAEKISQREASELVWRGRDDARQTEILAMKTDMAMILVEHKDCMRKLTDAFKRISELEKKLKDV